LTSWWKYPRISPTHDASACQQHLFSSSWHVRSKAIPFRHQPSSSS
jgi:hypothetical protein